MKSFNWFAPALLVLISQSSQAGIQTKDVQSRVNQAVSDLRALMNVPETSIPRDLVRAAECIAQFQIYKGGFIFGGQGGNGLASCRDARGQWAAPLFVDLGGVTWGLQFGFERVDLTLVYTAHNAADELKSSQFKLSGDAGLTVGPVGRDLSAGTDFQLKEAIYSYSMSKGFFGGITLDGSVLSPDKKYNSFVYPAMDSNSILGLRREAAPAIVMPYVDTLSQY